MDSSERMRVESVLVRGRNTMRCWVMTVGGWVWGVPPNGLLELDVHDGDSSVVVMADVSCSFRYCLIF